MISIFASHALERFFFFLSFVVQIYRAINHVDIALIFHAPLFIFSIFTIVRTVHSFDIFLSLHNASFRFAAIFHRQKRKCSRLIIDITEIFNSRTFSTNKLTRTVSNEILIPT